MEEQTVSTEEFKDTLIGILKQQRDALSQQVAEQAALIGLLSKKNGELQTVLKSLRDDAAAKQEEAKPAA